MAFAFKQASQWVLFENQVLPLDGGTPFNVPSQWTPEEKLARFGLYQIVEDSVPLGKVVVSQQLVDDSGHPRILKVLADSVVSTDSVNLERDRRTYAGFMFMGKMYDFDQAKSKPNITGAGILAFIAIVSGAQAGNYHWNGKTDPFSFIAQDNTEVPMDAQTVVAFGRTASEWEMAHVFAARAVKSMSPIPADYASDSYWPTAG